MRGFKQDSATGAPQIDAKARCFQGCGERCRNKSNRLIAEESPRQPEVQKSSFSQGSTPGPAVSVRQLTGAYHTTGKFTWC